MLFNIALAALLMVMTTAIHTGGMILVMCVIRSKTTGHMRPRLQRTPIYRVGGVVVLMFLVSVLEVLVWAVAYLALNAIQSFEQATYFSMVTFTTLGYGDVVLAERWRLLASFEAANGIIMFGWTTAIVLAVVQRVYFSQES